MTTVPLSTRALFLLLTSPLALALGCEREQAVSIYQAPKDAPVQPVMAAAAQPGAAAGLHWTAPAAWKESPSKQSMRVATFLVADGDPPVELTVIPLGAEAGAVLPNVNRWEGQLGLPPSSQEKLGEVVKRQKVGELEVDVVDLTAPETANPRLRMLAAITMHGGKSWFFKMTGPVDVIAKQKENFAAFIGSLHAGHEGDGHDHAGHDHAANPAAPGAAAAAPAARPAAALVSRLKGFTAPTGWRELPDSKPPRIVAFQMGEGDKSAELIATQFAANNAGSFMDNVNRWRGQIGLPPVNDPEAVKLQDVSIGKDGQGIVVEFENPAAESGKKMLVLIASSQADLWFFKLTGPIDVVNGQRANFDAFVKSLQFGGDGESTQQPKP